MFVPSLSWQNDHHYMKVAQKDAFSYLHGGIASLLPEQVQIPEVLDTVADRVQPYARNWLAPSTSVRQLPVTHVVRVGLCETTMFEFSSSVRLSRASLGK
jgi:hypothetical protein